MAVLEVKKQGTNWQFGCCTSSATQSLPALGITQRELDAAEIDAQILGA